MGRMEIRGGGELAETGHVRPELLGPPCSSLLNACRAVNIYSALSPECLPPMLVALPCACASVCLCVCERCR